MFILRNLKFRFKLAILNTTSIVFLLIIGSVSFFYMNKIAVNSAAMYEQNLLQVKAINQVKSNFNIIMNDILGLMLTEDENMNHDLNKNFEDTSAEIDKLMQQFRASILSQEEQTLFDQITAQRQALRSSVDKVLALALANKNEEAYAVYLAELVPGKKAVEASIVKLSELTEQDALNRNSENSRASSSAKLINVICLAAAFAASLPFNSYYQNDYTSYSSPAKNDGKRGCRRLDRQRHLFIQG
ncbi:MCP four helix bundle domain-containing protein [Paenibacillus caui]|uniref:MCP four helix bundle domain-containing protein n=1 Tax=Paenibacillus caui TaxID=2873927 RepID=UPI001F3007B9|nr:MCP four helix bundle domain-containing protein [Paenibacillus caui]